MSSRIKQTKVGEIPEGWKVKPLEEVAYLSRGRFSARPRNDPKYFGGSIPFIQTGEVSKIGTSGFRPSQYLNDDGLKQSKLFPAGTLFFTIAANIADVGMCDFAVACPDSIVAMSARAGVDIRWLLYDLSTKKAAFEALATPGAQLNLNLERLKPFELVVPPLSEQAAIADTLVDLDNSIDANIRLIAKKRDLQTAAIQRLLSAETRLPGFHEAWRQKRLGDHVAFLKNGVQSRAQLTLNDPVRYLHYGDIHVSQSLRLNIRETEMPRLRTADAIRLSRLEDGDLIFVDASEDLAGVGKSLEISGAEGIEAVAGQHTIAARFDKEVLADGFKGYLQHIPAFTTHLRRLAAGTKVYATNRKHIASAEILLPEPEEQRAIVRVLSDMDAEITALEARLDKTRALKQGMMQALLTGRVRLPVQREALDALEVAHA